VKWSSSWLERFNWRRFVVVGVVAALALVGQSFVRLAVAEYQLHAQERQLQGEIAQLAKENSALETQVAYLRSDAAIEKLAREELGWTRPGETAVVVIRTVPPATASDVEPTSTSAETPSTWRQWLDGLLQGLRAVFDVRVNRP
jgi:cell division protein FtsL